MYIRCGTSGGRSPYRQAYHAKICSLKIDQISTILTNMAWADVRTDTYSCKDASRASKKCIYAAPDATTGGRSP